MNDQPTPEQSTPEQPTPDPSTPEQPTPNQPTPNQPTPEQPTPEQSTPDQHITDQPNTDPPTPDQETHNESIENQVENQAENQAEKTRPKFVYNCTRCGNSCIGMKAVPVTLADLEGWSLNGTLASVMHFLSIRLHNDFPMLVMAWPDGMDEGKTGCPMYDPDNKLCNIYHSLPLHCASYPLGFDGKNYVLKNKACSGLGQGSMTEEQLATHRDKAKEDYDAKVRTNLVFPVVQAIVMQMIMAESRRAMESLSDQERDQLSGILGTEETGDDCECSCQDEGSDNECCGGDKDEGGDESCGCHGGDSGDVCSDEKDPKQNNQP